MESALVWKHSSESHPVDECYWSRDTSMNLTVRGHPLVSIFVVVGSQAYVYGGGLKDWMMAAVERLVPTGARDALA
jgi:hypothetical protein